MRLLFSLISFMLTNTLSFAQTVTISGVAPTYVGSSIEIYRIADYFSHMETLVTSSTVKEDSTFSVSFSIPATEKIIVKSKNNKGFLFVQKGGKYNIFFPEKNKFEPFKPTGNNVEVGFYDLDSTDINYKILGFQRWVDHFVGSNYYRKNTDPKAFSESLDRFKSNVEKAYSKDTSSYFKTHVRFSIAGLDNIQTSGERNRYEKHDFYIKHTPVQYNNEVYMSYISDFYERMIPRLSNQANQEVYEGVLKSSPTAIMTALGSEYTLINLRIRELIMIKSLAEVYNSPDFPQTNIATILDSLSNNCLFEANQEIAKNLIHRITSLVPGVKAPDIVFMEEGKETKTLFSYRKKHLYIHFFNPESESSKKEIPLLIEEHNKYKDFVTFISVYKKNHEISASAQQLINSMEWEVYGVSETNSVWKKYEIEAYPQYTLIDAAGYIVSSPSLGPLPNGQYETIDKTFFHLKKAIENQKER
ncbi:MAG: thioredoxin family protein [Crocinitomicaceae bacterium]|nr:thioredoxin family protein [Crocinitomicaceae bacterium]